MSIFKSYDNDIFTILLIELNNFKLNKYFKLLYIVTHTIYTLVYLMCLEFQIKIIVDKMRTKLFAPSQEVQKYLIFVVIFSRILNGVSNIIPTDKLELYHKTYKAVNSEMYTKLPAPDNWATWCIDRYACYNTIT